MRQSIILTILLGILLGACGQNEEALSFRREYTMPEQIQQGLFSGEKLYYIQAERTINQRYVDSLNVLVNTAFENQLDRFEDEELGVWKGYKRMVFWLFSSKTAWDDDMRLLSDKYFNNLGNYQEQHLLYLRYTRQIGELRQQFAEAQGHLDYTQIDLPQEQISLSEVSGHTKANIALEVGSELLSWFLGFCLTQVLLFILSKVAGFWGCLIDIVVLVITCILSMFVSIHYDNKLMESLRIQQQQTSIQVSRELVNTLNQNTQQFYEAL